MKKEISSILLATIALTLISCPAPAKKSRNQPKGDAIFAQYCAKCHAGGGNVVKANSPVYGSKQLSTLATFKSYLNAPPGHMPYYQELLGNKEALEALYKYCKQLKPTTLKQA